MKKIWFAAILLMAFSCNPFLDPHTFDEHSGHGHDSTEVTEPQQDLLRLDDGHKWKADSKTNANIEDLQKIVKTFKEKPDPATEDYQELNGELARGVNKLIQQSQLSVGAQSALQFWLAPILKENPKLKDITTREKYRASLKIISDRLDQYKDFFE